MNAKFHILTLALLLANASWAQDATSVSKGKLTLSSKVKVYTLGGQLIYEGEGSNFQLKSGTYVIKTDKGSIKRAYK